MKLASRYSSPAGRFVFLCRLLRMPFLPPVSRRRRIARAGFCVLRSWRCRIFHPAGRLIFNEHFFCRCERNYSIPLAIRQ